MREDPHLSRRQVLGLLGAAGAWGLARAPFRFREGRAAVVGCDLQPDPVTGIDFVFSPPERREQAGSYIKDCYLHVKRFAWFTCATKRGLCCLAVERFHRTG